MSEALSLYVARQSRVHQLHPLTKLTLAGFMLVGGLSLPGPWALYVFWALVILPLAFSGQILSKLILATIRIAFPFALSVFLIQGFLWPGGTPFLAVGPLSLKQEGLAFAVASTGRILMVISSFLWFALTTRPDHLMMTLGQRGFPAGLSYMIVATLQIVPRFQARASAILDAQRSRGLETEGNLARRLKALLPLVVPLVLSSLIDVEERALAIETRGFNRPGSKTSLIAIREASWEPAARTGILICAALVVGLSLWLR
jgi:energy-coupling factor transport system permease protein